MILLEDSEGMRSLILAFPVHTHAECADSDQSAHKQSVGRALISGHTFCSIQWFC